MSEKEKKKKKLFEKKKKTIKTEVFFSIPKPIPIPTRPTIEQKTDPDPDRCQKVDSAGL
jgi:hypothetical protein